MTNPDEELLADLLLRWEELQEEGVDAPAVKLTLERPDLIPELDRRIRILKAAAWLDRPINDDPPDDADAPGSPPAPRTLGRRYRLDDLIAEGGFARVYRAYDVGLQRTVAVKMPKRDWPQPPDAFLAEARRIARLKHDGIVPVFDVGVDGDDCYIVTEYVEGGSLADRLARRLPAAKEAISWIADIGDALEYAHLHGVVHRDIKPANILIDHHGAAKLADFGISQSATRANANPTASPGTLWYMSPEQLSSQATDHRSDIYSLAVVLHEALAGSPPYSAREPVELRAEILGERCVVSDTISARLRPILRKALCHSPHDRHSSASHFAADLRNRARPRSRGIAWLGAASATAIVGLLISGWSYRPTTPDVPLAPEAFRRAMARATTAFFHSQYEDAEAGFTKVLNAYPQNKQALADRGVCRMKLGRIDEAVEDFSAALVQSPHDHEVLRNRSQAYVYLRRYDEAIADLEMVAENFPELSSVPQQLATIHAVRASDRRQAGDIQGAISELTKALAYKPDMPPYYQRRAECHALEKNFELAVADWNEAIKRWSKDPGLRIARARCLRELGRNDEAEADEKKAEELRQ